MPECDDNPAQGSSVYVRNERGVQRATVASHTGSAYRVVVDPEQPSEGHVLRRQEGELLPPGYDA